MVRLKTLLLIVTGKEGIRMIISDFKEVHYLILVSFLILFMGSCHQSNTLNLDLEVIDNGLPANWGIQHEQPGFSVTVDSINVKSGKYSVAMEFKGDFVDYQGFVCKLPHRYKGEKITLSGYIKTENVTDGFAGLWLMIDTEPVWRPYEMSFMEQRGVTGTNDWKKCEITLDMDPLYGNEIEIGGLLSGKGKMWLDELAVTIDGKNIDKVKQYKSACFPIKKDNNIDVNLPITFPVLSLQKIEDLELLGKIWGFLKYHHPKIAKGHYNWDYELFKILPTYLSITNHAQRDKMLIKWIKQYGITPKREASKLRADNVFLEPDLSWIENSDISSELKNTLSKIYKNRNQGYQYYVRMRPYTYNPVFLNEEDYMGKERCPAAEFRLLSLFRYWNMINYFFPYKYMTDKNWNSILQEYIPLFIESESRLEYELVSARLLGEIGDSHAFLQEGWEKIEALKGSKQVPALVKFCEDQLVVVDAGYSELKRGDIITHIEGKSIEFIISQTKPYYPASNEVTRMNDIARDILRSNNDYIQIQYVSASGEAKQKIVNTINRKKWLYDFHTQKDIDPCYKFIDKDIGYINLKNMTKEDIPVVKQKFINTKGIIIDLRNLPSDIYHLLAPYFVSETTGFSKQTRGNPDNPGEFVFLPTYRIPASEKQYKGKLVVIVNEETGSNAEYTAMAFQAGENTMIVGSQTGGFDGNISEITLPGGLITYISGNGVYYPDGKETQRIGIVPDIEVKPSVQGIREGRDELLEKAVECIR